ncbi:CDP-alcohol phosphatidyltransferase family protein [Phenylobacterium sp.]|uniref:CDP-alcohol phosphatidyltransferase family protein n=1 Tax=Phenylobacterium sp. TaxID=1871053 RepID=UPI0027357231|nr:CDP-alcohol phosphatidyltransferase family protein [Phenylobacterium sp.]MDP3661216.1 CDP-alcohol phosphatidyltransferase family protein [Phenylobacterium sp.]
MNEAASGDRRPLKSRAAGWAQALAAAAARGGASPDLISAASVAFAGLGAALLMLAGINESPLARGLALIGAAACTQLRLLCNLLDGMVAVEHGRGGPSGPIWNEMPDRIADALLLVGAGYCAYGSKLDMGAWLGWLAACLAILTAYVRELGRGFDFPADFSGPMAKPHRMAALTITCVISVFEPFWGLHGQCMLIGLVVIAAGSAWTVVRRTRTLARRLAERAAG